MLETEALADPSASHQQTDSVLVAVLTSMKDKHQIYDIRSKLYSVHFKP